MEVLLVFKKSMVIESHKGQYSATFCENGAENLVNNLPDKLKNNLIPKYEGFPDIQSALKMPPCEDNDFQETINYLLKQDEAYKGTKWEMHLFDVFPELKEFAK